MILVGLTGGIGSGKSTVSAMLAAMGAVIIDGDVIARELQQRGTPVLASIRERFGAGVINPDGELNRAALAAIVFPQPSELEALNAIMQPALSKEILNRVDTEMNSNKIVVLDMPLLAENPRSGLSGIIVVDVDPLIARKRLIEFRNMSSADVDARMARQITRNERNAIGDLIIDNSGSQSDLRHEVERAWKWISTLPSAQPGAGRSVK